MALPIPESDDLGRYLEDTITIDWQTPSVADCARRLLAEGAADAPPSGSSSESETVPKSKTEVKAGPGTGLEPATRAAEARVERLFRFVRDAIDHTFDLDADALARRAAELVPGWSPAFVARGIAGRASEVLALRHGLCFAKSHLLAALLRFAGIPTGFCYVRLVDDDRPGRFVLHGFNACYWRPEDRWIYLDPRGDRGRAGEAGAIATDCRFAAPYSLAFVPDPERGEGFLPFVYRRPAKRVVDFLERVPDLGAMRRNLPDGI